MSVWGDYQRERFGHLVIENDDSFVVFRMKAGECFIVEFAVARDKRKMGIGRKLLDDVVTIAKANAGCKLLVCTVNSEALNANDSLLAALAYGFKLYGTEKSFIWLKKEI
jgi:predicted GNAT superfamily acetyltransferase